MVSLLLWTSTALSAGFRGELGWTVSHGPDAWGRAELLATAAPGLEVGALAVGGTRSALFAEGARALRLGERVRARGLLRLGMVEQTGPEAGLGGRLDLDLGPVVAVAGGEWTGGLGWRLGAGVDAPLPAGWTLSPRIQAETWAGDRDPALRVAMGARHALGERLWLGAELSAGGRDVFHLGPGLSLVVGRQP